MSALTTALSLLISLSPLPADQVALELVPHLEKHGESYRGWARSDGHTCTITINTQGDDLMHVLAHEWSHCLGYLEGTMGHGEPGGRFDEIERQSQQSLGLDYIQYHHREK